MALAGRASRARATAAGGARGRGMETGAPGVGALLEHGRSAKITRPMSGRERAHLWLQKWRWYERSTLPWNRARIHWEFARRQAFCRWPVHGNVLEAFRAGRLDVGEHTLLEPHVWLTLPDPARVRIGSGTFLNIGVMVAAMTLLEVGDHCTVGNGW